jgi:5,10-methylenetetrahydrofolate reductase
MDDERDGPRTGPPRVDVAPRGEAAAMKHGALLLERLARPGPLVSVELRPPRADLAAPDGMSAWIDLHHTLGSLTRRDLFVFLTDNAVGAAEEENLAHVGANVGDAVDLRRIVPILTCKHALEYCLTFALRAASDGFDALTVLGGDKGVGAPRCVPHGRDLRELIRARVPSMTLGGWANPHRDAAEQVGHLTASDAHADFALTQIVSHHSIDVVGRFLDELGRSGAGVPVVFGVFFYRSANPATLSTLSRFFPVPVERLSDEFGRGRSAEDICARTIRELREAGADKVYVSNLGSRAAGRRLARILERV